MERGSSRTLVSLWGLLFLALAALVGCERPDPLETVVAAPTLTPTPEPSQTIEPTQPPVQVYVVVVQPTPEATQPVAGSVPVSAPTQGQVEPSATPTAVATPEPTPYPEDYVLGWAWTESLFSEEDESVVVEQIGIVLRDRPSVEGRKVGIVLGMAEVIPVGREYCGYTPVLVYVDNMLTRTTPHPEIWPPEPKPTELPPFAPPPVPIGNATSGWAYTDAITVLGETAISGALGINLRGDPCIGATNLGSNMIVVGPAREDYTPVRVSNEVLQLPFDEAGFIYPESFNEGPVESALQQGEPVATTEADAAAASESVESPVLASPPTFTSTPTATLAP
jgi:hypothetical protein